MWISKLSFDGSKSLIGSRTLKHKINIFAFPLSYLYKKDWIIVNITGIILGEEKNKKVFLHGFRKSPRFVNMELNENFFIATIKEPIYAKTLYNEKIIHLSPALIDENGKETINIASFDKKDLVKALKTLEKNYEIKLHFLKQQKIKNISVMQQAPELTDKQKQAMELAIKHGYYEYPRKIDIQDLAKLSKLSFSTYHAHLRKAEQKLLPFFFEK